jgi:hypothetical protein
MRRAPAALCQTSFALPRRSRARVRPRCAQPSISTPCVSSTTATSCSYSGGWSEVEWRRCAARLINGYTRNAAHRYFTTTYPNFMQCAGGLEDGATRCAQLLNMLHDLPREDQDLDDPAVFINTDIRNAFQETCRVYTRPKNGHGGQTSFDTLIGVATQTYDGGRVQPGDTIPTIDELEPFLGYFWAMHRTECTNRFTDHCGRTHHVTGTTGGQQGDGMEMGRYRCSSTFANGFGKTRNCVSICPR